MGEHPRNAMKGITLDGDTCTLMVGAQENGTRIGLLVFLDGLSEPEGYDFPFGEAERMHDILGRALDVVRARSAS
jgi:hypothetical protein